MSPALACCVSLRLLLTKAYHYSAENGASTGYPVSADDTFEAILPRRGRAIAYPAESILQTPRPDQNTPAGTTVPEGTY